MNCNSKMFISLRKESENATTPNLDMQYAAANGVATRPDVLATLIMRPLVILSSGRNALVTDTIPQRLTVDNCFHFFYCLPFNWPRKANPCIVNYSHKPFKVIIIKY